MIYFDIKLHFGNLCFDRAISKNDWNGAYIFWTNKPSKIFFLSFFKFAIALVDLWFNVRRLHLSHVNRIFIAKAHHLTQNPMELRGGKK